MRTYTITLNSSELDAARAAMALMLIRRRKEAVRNFAEGKRATAAALDELADGDRELLKRLNLLTPDRETPTSPTRLETEARTKRLDPVYA